MFPYFAILSMVYRIVLQLQQFMQIENELLYILKPNNLYFFRYKKRYSISPNVAALQEREPTRYDYELRRPVAQKRRGLRDPLDPRNLFRAIYGYRKR